MIQSAYIQLKNMILEKRDMSDLSNIILSAAIRLLVFVYY